MTPAADPARDAAILDAFRQDRVYLGADHSRNERRTWIVTAISAVTLIGLLAGGALFHSMALTASGLHMGAHVAALLVAAAAYGAARRWARDPRFAWGAGKLGYLAGFANAVVLAITAILIAVESIQRLLTPESIDYGDAMAFAAGGLVLNLICAWLLRPVHAGHSHDELGDVNLSAAHLHLTGDAVVSALTIAGLAAGKRFGWSFADPLLGVLGAVLVAQFAVTLIRRASAALLDMRPSPVLADEVRRRLESDGERVLDLHLWRLGPGHHAAVAVVGAEAPRDTAVYHARLQGLAGLSHATIEVRAGGHRHGDERA